MHRKIPYVFLSNTGAKGSQGTQTKLAKMGFMMQHRPVPLQNIYTAAQAQVAYMVSTVPRRTPTLTQALTHSPTLTHPPLSLPLSSCHNLTSPYSQPHPRPQHHSSPNP